MSNVRVYAISCSSDGDDIGVRSLYIWGQIGRMSWLPKTKDEAKKRIALCKEEKKCDICDPQIHVINIERTKKTKLQMLVEDL